MREGPRNGGRRSAIRSERAKKAPGLWRHLWQRLWFAANFSQTSYWFGRYGRACLGVSCGRFATVGTGSTQVLVKSRSRQGAPEPSEPSWTAPCRPWVAFRYATTMLAAVVIANASLGATVISPGRPPRDSSAAMRQHGCEGRSWASSHNGVDSGPFAADQEVCETPGNRPNLDSPLPRPKRRRRRAKADRGLPPDKELAKLATAYLERQRKHWPKLVEAGLLPEPTEAVIREMVPDFKVRHRTGKVDAKVVHPFTKWAKLAGGYSSSAK